MAAKIAPPRFECRVCHEYFTVTKAGMMRSHNGDMWVGGWRQLCAGIGQPPVEVNDDH